MGKSLQIPGGAINLSSQLQTRPAANCPDLLPTVYKVMGRNRVRPACPGLDLLSCPRVPASDGRGDFDGLFWQGFLGLVIIDLPVLLHGTSAK